MEAVTTGASAATPAVVPAWRRHAVLLVGALMVLSCFAHGILGWSLVRKALVDAGTPIDLIDTLAIGWRFGSVAMAAFGLLVLATWSGLRGRPWNLPPAVVIAWTYVLFGVGALIASRFDTHFLVFFLLPGLLLLAGLSRRR